MKEELKKIGLSDTEASVYLCLLENTRLTPSAISRLTGIKRTTIYSASDEMFRVGIIRKDVTRKLIYYSVAEPAELKNLISRQKRKIHEQENELQQLLDKLERIPRNQIGSVPRIQFINESEIENFFYTRFPVWVQNMVDINETTQWGFQDDSILEKPFFKKIAVWYWNTVPKHTDIKMFGSNPKKNSALNKEIPKDIKGNRQFKFVKDLPFSANQWVIGEYVINYMASSKPNYLVEIRDRLLADNLRLLYKKLWNNS